MDEHTHEWLEENKWYQTNPKLRDHADTIANELANVLTFNNQSHMIGTPEFRQSITNLMRDEYGLKGSSYGPEESYQDQDQDQDQDQQHYHQSNPSVSPVTRKGTSMADQYMARNQNANGRFTPLTKAEYNIARHLPIKGSNASEIDLARRYEKAKKYPSSPYPGGTPHRLTIL